MTWADDTGRSFSRSRPATLVSHRGTTWSGVGEQVVVPPGRLDPRAVARRVRQAGVRPRDPGHHRPRPRHPLEHARVGRGGGQRVGERRRVPGAADDDDAPSAALAHLAQDGSHVGLAPGLVVLVAMRMPGVRLLAQRGHRLGDGLESRTVRTGLDDVVPPALGVVVPGGLGQQGDRVGPDDGLDVRVGLVGLVRLVGLDRCAGRPVGEHGSRREVDEASERAVVHRPPQRLPLGGEDRIRPEDRAGRRGGVVGEQRDGRFHAVDGDEADQ